MTENEALILVERMVVSRKCEIIKTLELKAVILNALEEIQSYRAIGTVEEIIHSNAKALVEQVELEKYKAIGTIEEFKALKEKNAAKKPNQVSKAMDKDKYVGLIGRCPNCGSIVAEDMLVCEDCFQVLDWSE